MHRFFPYHLSSHQPRFLSYLSAPKKNSTPSSRKSVSRVSPSVTAVCSQDPQPQSFVKLAYSPASTIPTHPSENGMPGMTNSAHHSVSLLILHVSGSHVHYS